MADRGHDAGRDRPRDVAAECLHFLADGLQPPQQVLADVVEVPPRRRRDHTLRGALEQLHFQLVLDLLDVDGEGRLGDVLALRGAGDAPGLVDGDEEADFADVDHQPPR